MKLNINYTTLINIYKSKKDFILFDYDNNKLTAYKLTNDYARYKNNFKSFRVISTLKNEIDKLEINI